MGFLSALFDQEEALSRKAFKAASNNDFVSALELIAQGGNVNYLGKITVDTHDGTTYSYKCTLGHAAIDPENMGNTKALKALLDAGLNIESKSGSGQTLLVRAVACEHEAAAELLLKRGACGDITFRDMSTLEDLARENGMCRIAELIAEQTASSHRGNVSVAVKSDTTITAPSLKFGKSNS